MKKRIALMIGTMLSAAVACDREPCSLCTEEVQTRHIRLGLSGGVSVTKAFNVSDAQENAVKICKLYVFDQYGSMVNSFDSENGNFDFYLTDAVYDFVAVVNKSGLPSSDISKRELLELSTTLTENTVGSFVMAGSLDGHHVQSDESLTVEVKRIVSKVSYKIRTSFSGALAGKAFYVEEIFLTNVAGTCRLSMAPQTPSDGIWYNKMNLDYSSAAAAGDLLYGSVKRSMAPLDSIWSGHSFYPYPNESVDNHDKKTWTARCTRFVVKASLGGKTTYYPVTIPVAASNKHYHIDVTIGNYGVDEPEDAPGQNESLQTVVTVSEWIDGGIIHGEF